MIGQLVVFRVNDANAIWANRQAFERHSLDSLDPDDPVWIYHQDDDNPNGSWAESLFTLAVALEPMVRAVHSLIYSYTSGNSTF
ncbi:hypothetical protein BDZ45DRAFT_746840 [Acephala macrosclerotiorum]|nr:hypothetical protein BDZ45DRAFT_746840 [Acephala macrosclerotiorum]